MELPTEALDRSVLVVAHPDDEVLWFSSILDDVDRIVIVFDDAERDPELHAARRSSIAGHACRDKIVNLGMPELETASTDEDDSIAQALTPYFEEVRNVFTHNPWGEDGHEDHIRVHKIVTALTIDRATIWYSNAVSGKSSRLMRRYVDGFRADYFSRAVDRERAREIADTYIANGAWTFAADYRWFPSECFVRGPLHADAPAAEGTLFPVNYIRVPFDPVATGQRSAGIVTRVRHKIGRIAGLGSKVTGDAATG